MKIMFSLLANAFELARIWNPQNTGIINSYQVSLEHMIRDIQQRYADSHPAYKLSIHLHEQIKSVKNPYFLGYIEN